MGKAFEGTRLMAWLRTSVRMRLGFAGPSHSPEPGRCHVSAWRCLRKPVNNQLLDSTRQGVVGRRFQSEIDAFKRGMFE